MIAVNDELLRAAMEKTCDSIPPQQAIIVTVFVHSMTGLELMESHFAERNLKRFGSYGKGEDRTWKHYIWIATE